MLTSQVALPARSQPGSSSPPTAHAGSGAEGLSWGHRPQLQPHSPSTELLPGNSRAPLHKASPAGRGRRICSLEELMREQRGLQPLLSVLLCRALLSLQNGKHVSLTEPQAVSVCLQKAASCRGLHYCSSQGRGNAA